MDSQGAGVRRSKQQIGRRTLGNYAASGTQIIEDLGAEHMRTGRPIVYTSADSVFQIAAHEDHHPDRRAIPDQRDRLRPGGPETWPRARHCPSLRGAARQLQTNSQSERLRDASDSRNGPGSSGLAAHVPTIAIGKIEDLFAGRGITRALHTRSDDEGVDAVASGMESTCPGADFRQPCRFRHGVRSQKRCRGICSEPRTIRRAAEGPAASFA